MGDSRVVKNVSTGTRFEEMGAYVRAKRVGQLIFVAGTTAVEPSGEVHMPGDTYRQSVYVLKRIEDALVELGSCMAHVVRTRSYLADMSTSKDFLRAHGEVFREIKPVATAVEARLIMDGMMVEIEVDAVMPDPDG